MNASLNLVTLTYAIGIAAAFSSWPIVGKYTGAAGSWVNTIVLIASTIGGIALALPQMTRLPYPSWSAVVLVGLAGLANGAAVYFYSVKAADPTVPVGRFIMAVIILMVLWSIFFAWMLSGEALTPRQWIGVGAAILAIFLLAH